MEAKEMYKQLAEDLISSAKSDFGWQMDFTDETAIQIAKHVCEAIIYSEHIPVETKQLYKVALESLIDM